MRKIAFTRKNNRGHWVGDGFPVRNLFSYNDVARELSPFLLLDYAGPTTFPPTTKKLGVGEHPHRGFETVSLIYAGEVEHRDSAGGGGKIGPGEVQWMTAGAGVVHEEFHGTGFAKTGGAFEMIQLWVNLPQKHKMTAPRYQTLSRERIPEVALPEGAGLVRVIAGEFSGIRGPAETLSPMNVWDVRLQASRHAEFTVQEGWTSAFFILKGSLRTPDGRISGEAELVVLETSGRMIRIEALEDTTVLFLSGEPLNEPIVGYGPFVMNTEAEIKQAFLDFNAGKMGRIVRT